MNLPSHCPNCGGTDFVARDVLWPSLIDEWQLAPYEAAYINRQQGIACRSCGANLRSMGLAQAIMDSFGFFGRLIDFVVSPHAAALRVLEINEAGGISQTLGLLPKRVFARFPEYDMTALPFPDQSFDLVVHSDTLEHVPNATRGLSECRRVLSRPDGRCVFTVPIIVDRFTRSRAGLPLSSHAVVDALDDCTVHTEFGANVWTDVMKAGFSSVRMISFEYPAAISIEAR